MNTQVSRWGDFTEDPKNDLGADAAVYRTLLESTLAIPWRIDWLRQEYTYIGPQVEALFGWPRQSWKTIQDWAERIHPDERDHIVHACVEQSLAGIDHEADFRMRSATGEYIWIRDIVHVVRDFTGEVDSLVGFMIDITPQKEAEQKLLELQAKLERLSYRDGLTELANRRHFNEQLEKRWGDAVREGAVITMALIDVDYFKNFNDFYGHIAGDDCLTHIANVLAEIGSGTDHVIARYGGEEFALLFPNTEPRIAREVAERCRQAVEALKISHAASDCSEVVTVSIGLKSTMPASASSLRQFCIDADTMLYEAKKLGRNRVV